MIAKSLEQEVRDRARDHCEYCHVPQWAYSERFQIDHVIARQHRGSTELDNLALCCVECNLRKGPNVGGIDPDTGQLTRLFHPRLDSWKSHFAWDGPLIIGLTPQGRATVATLQFNRVARLPVRAILAAENALPNEL